MELGPTLSSVVCPERSFRNDAKELHQNEPRRSRMPAHKSAEFAHLVSASMPPPRAAKVPYRQRSPAYREGAARTSPWLATRRPPSHSAESIPETAGISPARRLPRSACGSAVRVCRRYPPQATHPPPVDERRAYRKERRRSQIAPSGSSAQPPASHHQQHRARSVHPGRGCRRRSQLAYRNPRPGPPPPSRLVRHQSRARENLVATHYPSVLTSMPGSHRIWQLRQWGFPLIVTRHSKQMPIPQSGPRGWPLTEIRQDCAATAAATATVEPEATSTGTPLTLKLRLGMHMLLGRSGGQVRLDRDLGFRAGNLVHQNPRGPQRGRDAQPLVTSRQKQGLVIRPWANQGQLVRSGRPKSSPCPHRQHRPEPRHVFLRAPQHTNQNFVIHFLVFRSVLPGRANQDLTRSPWLHVKSDRVTSHGMCALQIT